MTRNHHEVPKKVWRSWTERGHRVFNSVMAQMAPNQNLFLHPRSIKRPPNEWRTTCWNAAWIAAEAASHNVGAKPRITISHMVPKGMVFGRDIVLDLMRQAWTLGYAARLDQEG